MKALSKRRTGVTIYEVARRAGVSIATVSRTMRDPDLVTPETRARVLAAVDELGFTPSRLGRSLAEGQHAANGIVFPDLIGPYYAEVVLGYEEVAADLGRSVLILATHGRRDAAAQVLELANRVDGMVVMGRTVGDDIVERIAASGPPLVLVARDPVSTVDTIRTDNERSARELAEHLLAHGHRRFAFVGDPDDSPDVAGRYAGFAAGLRAAGIPVPAPVRCSFDIEAGRAAAEALLRRRTRPQAVVCANDEVALGVHTAATDAGLSVPDDLAVTGWDDVMAARFAGLTTVRQPMRELGATAAHWLHDRITERSSDRSRQRVARRSQVLPTQLTVRRSCGTHHPREVIR
ncbi:LacI family DNA-binding transcriptional regulator [Phytohabitans sp. LJ34]|uniref:LacI family DNA-binding transcriptional regulator n=1 Tax=Phytohabitans sp. LJ34 TaxID=3452217 RepID=UPI003F89D42D